MRLLLALLLLVVSPAARATDREMIEIREGTPVTIRTDRAYLLFRAIRPDGVRNFEPILLRIPRREEMARYDAARRAAFARAEAEQLRRRESAIRQRADNQRQGRPSVGSLPPLLSLETFNFTFPEIQNVQNIEASRPFVRGRPESTYLVEVVPGDYVLYGISWDGGPAFLAVCMCLGTVGFQAPAGVITDLGYFFADTVGDVSAIPELRADSGFGPSISSWHRLVGATIRPAHQGSSMPEALRTANVRPATYRAVGKFVDPSANSINRLAPVPGILAYDRGRVVDVHTGTNVPDIQ